MQFVDFLPWRHCSHGWKNIFESLKCLLFWTSSEKKNRTSSGWQLDGRESSKSAFSNPKKRDNWQINPNIGMSSNPQRVLSRRYGTVLACNYQTPTVREDSLSRVRKRTHEKRYHNLNQKRRCVFLLRFFDGWEPKKVIILRLAAFPISEMQVKKMEITEATKVAWSIGQAIHVFSSDCCNFFQSSDGHSFRVKPWT